MSDDNHLPKPLAIVIGITTSTIAFITAIVGFILLWKGNTEIVSTVVLAVGIIGLWGSFFYIRFTKKNTGRKKASLIFSKKMRSFALFGIYIIPILVLTGVGINKYEIARQENEVVILIANFDGPDSQKYGVTQFLVEKIDEGISNINKAHTRTLSETITATQGITHATRVGRDEKADIIVWGWYVVTESGINVTYHIEILNFDNGLGVISPKDVKINVSAPIEKVNTFDFQSNQLPDNIVFDIQRSIYQVFIITQETPENGLAVVNSALDFLEKNHDSFDNYKELYSSVLSARASVYAGLHGFDRAISQANDAIAYYPSYDAYVNRAHIYAYVGDQEAALKDFMESLNQTPTEDSSYLNSYLGIGGIYEFQGNYKEAISWYTKGIEALDECNLQGGCHLLFVSRGIAFLKIDDKPSAEADFLTANSIADDSDFKKMLDNLLARY